MDEEISQDESLKQKTSVSIKPSQISQGTIKTIKEDKKENSGDELEGTITTEDAEISEYDLSTEQVVEKEPDEEEFLKNPGLSQAYKLGTVKPLKDEEDESLYLRLVKEVKIMPIRRIVNSINKDRMHLQYYGLDCKQIKPLTETLTDNNSVKELNLQSNILTEDALYHLGLMLRRNVCLTSLNLSQCKITAEGIELLSHGLEFCPQLAVLDLSYNEFGDQGMEVLAVKLCSNTTITDLNLSHNNLTHQTAIYLAEWMEDNYSLQHLNLSWNQISEDQGLKKFLYTAAEHNDSLLSLDLSWNTLSGEKTANIIKTFIGQHRTLQELNLSHNRFETAAEATKIAKGINTAQSLKLINLSYNGITADTAFALLSSINSKAKLNTLRLDNVWVKPEFEKLRRELESQIGMKVVIEGVTGGFGVKGPDMQTLLLKRARHLGYLPKKAKNKKDFGWFLLRLKNTGNLVPVKKAKFEKLVTEDKIKLDEGMVDELAKKFKDDNKKIDLALMLEKYLSLYPETVLPIPKEKKKKKTPKDKNKNEVVSPEKHDQKEEETKEGKEEEIRKSTEDITEPVTKEKSRESLHSQVQVTIPDKSENEIKEVEATVNVDQEIIEPELQAVENDIEQTEDNILTEKTELDLEDKVENVEETGINEENNTEENVVDMIKDEGQEEEELKEEKEQEKEVEPNNVEPEADDANSKPQKWKVTRIS